MFDIEFAFTITSSELSQYLLHYAVGPILKRTSKSRYTNRYMSLLVEKYPEISWMVTRYLNNDVCALVLIGTGLRTSKCVLFPASILRRENTTTLGSLIKNENSARIKATDV